MQYREKPSAVISNLRSSSNAPFGRIARLGLTVAADCGAQTAMQPSEFIRCKECGHRVMYKPRTTRSRLFGVSITL